jgi:ABC-type phosphate transport system auxiliary subunit
VDSLDEAAMNEVESKLTEIIDAQVAIKAQDISEKVIEEAKEELINEYEEKFEDYKNDVTQKFSNFIDEILEEELAIPEKVLEYARYGELYKDLIDQFKLRMAVDQGALTEEIREVLREAKSEIISLRKQLDLVTEEKLEVLSDAQDFAVALYVQEKCEGLNESAKKKIKAVLEGIKSKSEIDRKFGLMLESLDLTKTEVIEEEEVITSQTGRVEVITESKVTDGGKLPEDILTMFKKNNWIK